MVLGLPLIGSTMAQFVVGFTDTLMLGWYGVDALAAGVLGASFFFVLLLFGSGFAQAVVPVVASAMAAGQETQVRRTTRMGLWLSIIFGLVMMPVFLFADTILSGLGQAPEIAALSGDYLMIAGGGLIPALVVMTLRSYLSALERTQVLLWVTVIAAVVNALANYALIFGNWGAPELGVRGAAIASLTVHGFSALAMAVYAAWATREHALFQRFWRPDWEAFFNLFSLGWPIGLTGLAEVGLFSATALMMGWIGTVELAAHGIAIQIASLTFGVHYSFSQVATIRVGKSHGRGQGGELRRGALMAAALSGLFALATAAVFLIFPEPLLDLFMDPNDPVRPQVLLVGTSLLAVAALFQVADAGQVISLGLLRGLHDTRAPMVYAAISYWLIGMPASYGLGFTLGMGGVGIWLGLVFGLAVAWLMMMTRFWRKARHLPA